MKKAILLFGGSEVGRPKVTWAREESLIVILVDVNPEAPAAADADHLINCSRDDVDGIVSGCLRLAREHQLDIAFVYCGIDLGDVPARVAEALGAPGAGADATMRCLDKWKSKSLWLKEGIPTPVGFTCETPDDARAFASQNDYPIIVKAPDSSGSRGVVQVDTESHLLDAIRMARRHSAGGHFLVERLLVGTHHDVNGLFWDGKFHACGMMDRHFLKDHASMSNWALDPSQLDQRHKRDAFALLERAACALGVAYGPVKGDLVLTTEGFHVLEIAPRFHGDIQTVRTSVLGPGVNACKALFRAVATGSVDEGLLRPRARCAGWKLIPAHRPGVFRKIRGKDRALDIMGVEHIFEYRKSGQYVGALIDNTQIPGVVVASADTPDSLQSCLDAALGVLEVVTDE